MWLYGYYNWSVCLNYVLYIFMFIRYCWDSRIFFLRFLYILTSSFIIHSLIVILILSVPSLIYKTNAFLIFYIHVADHNFHFQKATYVFKCPHMAEKFNFTWLAEHQTNPEWKVYLEVNCFICGTRSVK